jgi:hypothetical protein
MPSIEEFRATFGDDPVPAAWVDVFGERRRQVEAYGFTPQEDVDHPPGDLERAAACYAVCWRNPMPDPIPLWPWPRRAWAPRSYRENLVRAAALLLAAIERYDLTNESPKTEGERGQPEWNFLDRGAVYDAQAAMVNVMNANAMLAPPVVVRMNEVAGELHANVVHNWAVPRYEIAAGPQIQENDDD